MKLDTPKENYQSMLYLMNMIEYVFASNKTMPLSTFIKSYVIQLSKEKGMFLLTDYKTI